MGSLPIKKRISHILSLIFIAGIIFISGCAEQNEIPYQQENISIEESFEEPPYLEIVVKDFGIPEVKYLQPTIKEIQLKGQDGDWVTIWSSDEGKSVKLSSDGTEMSLEKVFLSAGTYTETRLLVSSIGVEADINRDGDTADKNVQIIMTEEEFASLPKGEKPSQPTKPSAPTAPTQPSAPQKPTAPQPPTKPSAPSPPEGGDSPPGEEPQEPDRPDEPSEPSPPSEPEQPSTPSEPTAPSQPLPPGVQKIENGFVYMEKYLDEVHTATPPYFDGIHNDSYLYPKLNGSFVYDGKGGRAIYDFTLHPLKPKPEQITVSFTVTPLPKAASAAPQTSCSGKCAMARGYNPCPSDIITYSGCPNIQYCYGCNNRYNNYQCCEWVGQVCCTPKQPPPLTISSLNLSQKVVSSGTNLSGTVTLSGTAPPGGLFVQISSNLKEPVAFSPAVIVSTGQKTASFKIMTNQVSSPITVAITASLNATSKTASLTVNPVSCSYTCRPPTMYSGWSRIWTAKCNSNEIQVSSSCAKVQKCYSCGFIRRTTCCDTVQPICCKPK